MTIRITKTTDLELFSVMAITVKFPLLIFAMVVFQQDFLATHSLASANLWMQPLWNMSHNISQPCAIDSDNHGTWHLQGGVSVICRLQIYLLNDTGARIQTWSENSDWSSLFIEYSPDTVECPDAHGVIQVDGGSQCGIVLQYPDELTINLRGNVSLIIGEVTEEDLVPQTCSVIGVIDDSDPVGWQTPQCSIEGYHKTVYCQDPKSTWCSIYLYKYNCNVTVGDKEVFFQCKDYNGDYYGEKGLVLYNAIIGELDLSIGNVHVVDVNAFQSLRSLGGIYLYGNALTSLEVGVFAGLRNLYFLSLIYNALQDLPVGVFQDLESLIELHLAGNKLVALQTGVFVGLESLTTLELGHNNLQMLGPGLFQDMVSLKQIYLYNNQLEALNPQIFNDLSDLEIVDLYSNNIKVLTPELFQGLPLLNYIDLYGNGLQQVDVNLFRGLRELTSLYLNKNSISELDPEIFTDLINLKALSLADNQLGLLYLEVLKNQSKLTFLDLSGNNLIKLPDIKHLSQMSFLNLKENNLIYIAKDDFVSLMDGELYASQQEICECYVHDSVTCSAADPRSPYLTCDRLLSDRTLMALMWVIGFNAICGNLFVLIWRKTEGKENTVQSRLLANLAMSDLLMGVYMISIASADNYYGKYFPMQGETWRTGITCRVAGALSIVSSEASVFFVTLISIDRFMNMKYPLSTLKLRRKSALVVAGLIWVVSMAIGIVPSALAGINDAFYDNSHVCIGLPLAKMEYFTTEKSSKLICPENSLFCFLLDSYKSTSQGFKDGMYFSTALFLGLNCICYLVILGCYIEIIRAVLKSRKTTGVNQDMRDQMRLTAKVTAIVATDFFCWFPIIVLGILVQTEVVTLPPSVFAWSVTFVLPINSAINPYLYTISHVLSVYRKDRADKKSHVLPLSLKQFAKKTTVPTINNRDIQDSKL